MLPVIEELKLSDNPFIQYKVRKNILGELNSSPKMQDLQNRMKESPVARKLLSEKSDDGIISCHPYKKWIGAHWVIAVLADLEYPPGDVRLKSLSHQVQNCWLSESHLKRVKVINGRARRCASQEGNALYSILKLGFADTETDRLAKNLIMWQWPDGGWNCDKNPDAANSSFMETLIPMRALWLHYQETGSEMSETSVYRAAEVFLKRKLFKLQRDDRIISEDFCLLHYPCYWHYDILFGLKVMAEIGLIKDPGCTEAIDLLLSKQLSGGGFPAEKKYYRVSESRAESNISRVNWGGVNKKKANEYVTADALYVLHAAGKLKNDL